MTDTSDEIMLSLLADGELESDQLNQVLLRVLDDEPAREKLKEHLRLRQSLKVWRRQTPAGGIVTASESPRLRRRGEPRFLRQGGRLALAACVGALLVMAGFWLAGRIYPAGQPAQQGPPDVITVSPQEQAELVEAFRLHESVAGPLKWYAADERNIEVASSDKARHVGKPVAVLLRIHRAGEYEKTYALVVRDSQPASIDLPNFGRGGGSAHLHIVPVVRNGKVEMSYTVVISGAGQGGESPAILAGQQKVGLGESSLGQVSLDNQLVSFNASAWAIENSQ